MEELTEKESKALGLAVEAIYFEDSYDYISYLWQIVKALGGKEATDLLEDDTSSAFDKYCLGLRD